MTISRKGAIQALHFLQKLYIAGVLENAPVNSVVLTAVTNRPRDRVRLDFLCEDFANGEEEFVFCRRH